MVHTLCLRKHIITRLSFFVNKILKKLKNIFLKRTQHRAAKKQLYTAAFLPLGTIYAVMYFFRFS